MDIELRTTKKKSFGRRKLSNVTLGVVHYTDSTTLEGTANWLDDPRAQVSTHYLIGKSGKVIKYNDLRTKLWHAGRSEWNGRKHCNKFSIGYELIGTATSGFTVEQYDTLVELLLCNMTVCPLEAVVGHEQISPGRKFDPGKDFSWHLLSERLHENCRVKQVGTKLKTVGPLNYVIAVGEPLTSVSLNLPEDTLIETVEMPSGKDPWWKIW